MHVFAFVYEYIQAYSTRGHAQTKMSSTSPPSCSREFCKSWKNNGALEIPARAFICGVPIHDDDCKSFSTRSWPMGRHFHLFPLWWTFWRGVGFSVHAVYAQNISKWQLLLKQVYADDIILYECVSLTNLHPYLNVNVPFPLLPLRSLELQNSTLRPIVQFTPRVLCTFSLGCTPHTHIEPTHTENTQPHTTHNTPFTSIVRRPVDNTAPWWPPGTWPYWVAFPVSTQTHSTYPIRRT